MYKIILSFRYLLKRRISYLAFAAVALCVFIVVVVMTIMTGLVTDFKTKNHLFAGDCVVGTDSLVGFTYYEDFIKILEKQDFIEAISPVIKSYGLITRAGSNAGRGVEITGVDPVKHSGVTGFGKTLHYRRTEAAKAFKPVYDMKLAGCVLGVDLAMERNSKGEYYYGQEPSRTEFYISCFPLTARGALAKAGVGEVNTKTFYYSDTTQSGLARVDGSVVYLPFEEAQALCGMDGADKRINRIHIKFKQQVKLEDGCKKTAAIWNEFVKSKRNESKENLLETVTVQSWKENRRETIAAMEKEQTMLTAMFSLVGITTVFIVFVVFYMIVSHKSKDIGILKSVGVSSGDVIGLFSFFAFLEGCLGSCAGVICGWIFLFKINSIEGWLYKHFGFQIWDRSIYAIGDIPNRVEFRTVAVIMIAAIAVCLAGAIVPSWQAARLRPIESLQVNQL
jgi:lipoprotein-releasing system permease protein